MSERDDLIEQAYHEPLPPPKCFCGGDHTPGRCLRALAALIEQAKR